jgi:hypothetical protein
MATRKQQLTLRWVAITILVVSGLVLVGCGLLFPAHLRAFDARALAEIGRGSPTLVDEGIRLYSAGRIGQARLFLSAARQCEAPGTAMLERALADAAQWQATNRGVSELDLILSGSPWAVKWDGKPVMVLLASRAARLTVRDYLETAVRSGVREIMKTRGLTNLVHFSPAASAAGQPYESAVLLAALLVNGDDVPSSLRDDIESLAYGATRKGEVQTLELLYLDLVSLGTRLNWGQLVDLMNHIPALTTLRDLSNLARYKSNEWQVLFAAASLEASATPVTRYLLAHADTGTTDLKFALGHGQAALHALLEEGIPVHYPTFRDNLTSYDPFYSVFAAWLKMTATAPALSLALKYGLILLGSVFLGRAGIDLMPAQDGIAVKRWFSPAHLAFSGALLILAVALFEPLFFHHTETLNFPLHFKFPMIRADVRATITKAIKPMLDTLTVLALVFFLLIQGVIYIISLLKLAEIRRQQVPSKVKLRLLENEENMFDSGLYCGLGGTVLSLVFLAMGVIKPSLMAAYASTLFGIVFVAILKIFHLRPLRRKLILDSESQIA